MGREWTKQETELTVHQGKSIKQNMTISTQIMHFCYRACVYFSSCIKTVALINCLIQLIQSFSMNLMYYCL